MAGRPALLIGTYGKIWTSDDGKPYLARARFRDADGVTRPVVRTGQTKDAARRALRAALVERQRQISDSIISPEMTVAALADAWLAREHPEWSTGTRETYEGTVKRQVKGQLAGVRLLELRPAVINRALERVMATSGNGAAKTTRAVLAGMFEHAISHDAMQANPARGTVRIATASPQAKRALTRDEVERLCDGLRASRRALELDLPDLVEFMLGTGCRIGEALAARPAALDVEAGTWEINATLVRVRGEGLRIQPRPKTAAGWRVLALPPYVVDIIKRRETERRLQGPEDVVFPSPRAGALRDGSNTSGDLREVLDDLGFGWVHSHVFRKTVATRLDEAGQSARVIADQLGHAKPSMTQDVYLGRRVVSAEAARILNR